MPPLVRGPLSILIDRPVGLLKIDLNQRKHGLRNHVATVRGTDAVKKRNELVELISDETELLEAGVADKEQECAFSTARRSF